MTPDEKQDSADAADELTHPRGDSADVSDVKALTRTRAQDVRSLLTRYVRRHMPAIEKSEAPPSEPPRVVGSHAHFLPLMRIIPWVLAIGFGASFLWDFPGMSVALFGYTLQLEGLLRILSVSGLIGFVTNWLAITMLFNPRVSRPILGQGLIPAQRDRVIYRLSRAISDELLNETIIKQKIEESGVIPRYREMALSVARGVLEDEEFRDDLKALTVDYVNQLLASDDVRERLVTFTIEKLEEQLGEGISGIALRLYRFAREEDFRKKLDKAIRDLPTSLDHVLDGMDDMLDRIPARIEARSEQIEQWATQVVLGFVEQLDVYDMVMTNMKSYDDRKLEDLLKKTSNEQLNYIKYLGGILGAIGGLVIWKPLFAIGLLGSVCVVLFGIDETILRIRRRGSQHPPVVE